MAVIEFTEMSGRNVEFLLGEDKTPREIIEFLERDARVRTFRDTLAGIYQGEDLSGRLSKGLAEITGEEPGSVARKVRNWMKDKNLPKNRETLFQICFLTGADREGAARILGMAEGCGIHYRDPKELVYAYALKNQKSYQEAQELYQRIGERGLLPPEKEEKKTDFEDKALVYTRQVREAFEEVDSEEELMEFFARNRENLGRLHRTAWKKFDGLLSDLRHPQGLAGLEEKPYTLEELMEKYLNMDVPVTKNTGHYTLLQKVIKKYWPGIRNIADMQKQKEDVSRKALILLAVITEMVESFQADWDDAYILEEELWEEDADTRLLLQIQNMNLLLEECGMGRLDPCCPFDFLVLYALKDPDGEGMSERMQAVIKELFAGE